MQFLFQPLTWGFFLVLLPPLIHLINLMRQKRVRWAAMDFLVQSDKKHRTWVWLKQLLLLAARMAAIAMLVAMLAHLATRSQWSNFFGGKTTHHIVLLDDSFSMSDRVGSESAWDRANKVVSQLAQHVAGQDSLQRFSLIRFSQADTATPNAGEGADAKATDSDGGDTPKGAADADTLTAVADMMGRTVDADFESALEDARRDNRVSALASTPENALQLAQTIVSQSDNEQHDIYVVSDFRSGQWNQPEELTKSIKELDGAKARINLVRCSDTVHSNITITELRPIDGIRAAGVPMFVEVVVKNFSNERATQVTVALRVVKQANGGKAISTELPGILIDEIAPGESISRRAQVYFPDAGQHVLVAELSADAVTVDNQRFCVVDCEAGLPVLVIDGDPDQLNGRYLNTVFEPGERVRTGIRTELKQPVYLRDVDANELARFHAIYLLDVPRLDDRAARNLEQFVRDGGGVAIFLGPQADLGFYNGWYAGGRGFYPVPVQRMATLPSGNGPDLRVEPHPLFRVLMGERNAFIGSIRIQQYAAPKSDWQPNKAEDTEVLASLRNGDPLWVERRFGNGRVVTQLSSLAPRWNSWATHPTFPVLLLELQAHLNSSRQATIDRRVGAPIELSVDARKYQPQVDFLVPGRPNAESKEAPVLRVSRTIEPVATVGEASEGNEGIVRLGHQPGGSEVANTERPGVYEARLQNLTGTTESRKFALNVDDGESDLELASMDRLTEAVSGTKVRILEADALSLSARDSNRFTWSQLLMYLLVGLLLLEQFLAYSASYHPATAGVARAKGSMGGQGLGRGPNSRSSGRTNQPMRGSVR